MDLNNFNNFKKVKEEKLEENENIIEIFVKQRNGRKSIMTVLGLGNDKKKLKIYAKELNKKMSCSGSLKKKDDEYILLFTGKDVTTVKDYLSNIPEYSEYEIKVHGSNL